MQMRPEVQIQSILKAMRDTVVPALDPNNKLAQEQAKLIMGMLALMQKQMPVQFRFDCDELERLIGFSHEMQALSIGAAEAVDALQQDGEMARKILAGAQASPAHVLGAVKKLRSTIGSAVTHLFSAADAAGQAKLKKLVLTVSREQLLRDRSLLLTQGWEPDPAKVPDIESLLDIFIEPVPAV
ncbi:hypothetical protein [Pseudomonas fluorescens]|uniref:Uncharacterized protein n=1 Tax=Pseudomonas fluorescens TaxID=294 RepID=A0A5E7UY93_PSEFL|nr:hypothetical protein [Pseudomonas fluorescens]VVQ15410.1 hypothetical protein PS928_04259 [Pseudomonas fluorescens]